MAPEFLFRWPFASQILVSNYSIARFCSTGTFPVIAAYEKEDRQRFRLREGIAGGVREKFCPAFTCSEENSQFSASVQLNWRKKVSITRS
ncbi:hypothetical protein CDAR_536891 [Caerostris darwini]|uniref:Uncharacterized protein n=1 Tax=Caerostris darwini TaxID=1538125 RepID=A0AAV4NWA7_9ARAC|nr:hypothetical protein CDAR_536891 [Caerostris darwini]